MNLSAIFKAAQLAISLLPVISGFVQSTESALAGFDGAAKLKAVLAAVDAYLQKIQADAQVIEAVKAQLEPLVAGLVAGFNASGLFAHNSTSTAPASASAK